MRLEGRDVERGHEILRHHHAHHVADRVGREHSRDRESPGDLERERGFADATRAAEQQDERAFVLVLEVAPGQIAACVGLAESAREDLVGQTADHVAGHAALALRVQLALDLEDGLEGVPGVQTRRQQGLLQPPLAEGPSSVLAQHVEALARGRVEPLEVAPRRRAGQLGDQGPQLVAPHDHAVPHAAPDLLGDGIGVLEGEAELRQRVDQDAPHEGAKDAAVVHAHADARRPFLSLARRDGLGPGRPGRAAPRFESRQLPLGSPGAIGDRRRAPGLATRRIFAGHGGRPYHRPAPRTRGTTPTTRTGTRVLARCHDPFRSQCDKSDGFWVDLPRGASFTLPDGAGGATRGPGSGSWGARRPNHAPARRRPDGHESAGPAVRSPRRWRPRRSMGANDWSSERR